MARRDYQPVPQFEDEPVNSEIAADLHTNEAQINPTLKRPFIPPPPDPRDPAFEPKLEERAQRIIAAGLTGWDTNPCVKHLEILCVAFPEFTPEQYPRFVVQAWFAIKDWKWARLREAGISEDTHLTEIAAFDVSKLDATYMAVTRIQTAVVKYINTHKVAVPEDPRFSVGAEIRVRLL